MKRDVSPTQVTATWEAFQPFYASSPPLAQRACGKAIIVGEHGVVYGSKAVAMPLLNLEFSVRIIESEKSGNISVNGRSAGSELDEIIRDAFTLLGVDAQSIAIHCQSSIPVGAGLGSSASLCVAILRALSRLSGKVLQSQDLAHFGNKLEQHFHGTPSGLDTAVVAFERVISFSRGHEPEFITVSQLKIAEQFYPWTFVLIDSELRASTLHMIQKASTHFFGSAGEQKIRDFTHLSDEVIIGMTQGDLMRTAQAMNEASQLLEAIGVIPVKLSGIIEKARQLGALAAKSTGAGGGGCILALLDPRQSQQQVLQFRQVFGDNNVHTVFISA